MTCRREGEQQEINHSHAIEIHGALIRIETSTILSDKKMREINSTILRKYSIDFSNFPINLESRSQCQCDSNTKAKAFQ